MEADMSIDELCATTERAWIDDRDLSVVDRLAAEHPEHAPEIFDFFSALVFGTADARGSGKLSRRAANRTRRWLEKEGYERALEAGRRARTFVKFLQERTAERPDAIVRRIGDVTWEFLVLVSRYPALIPAAVRRELASRMKRAWEIPVEESLGRLGLSGPVPTAASRQDSGALPPSTFPELLERSSLGKKERSFWLDLDEPL